MAIETISISIYDTSLPDLGVEVLDFAQRSSIRWIYEGGDDKFFPIMASRLEFAIEVSIEESLGSLVYDYLFTGTETKYSVVMRDQEDNTIWKGFLLPEEYSEPYETGTFYVNLTATDGLGRLRGHKFLRNFYRARHSVIKIISDCLLKTGLELPIYINTSIENNVAGPSWETMFLDAQQWATDDDFTNCYDILEAVLNGVGATIFQQNDRWYITGWNFRGKSGTTFNVYSATAQPQGQTGAAQSFKPLELFATPTLSIKAPFREIVVTENLPSEITIFPEELISQPWVMTGEDQTPPPVKFWKMVGDGLISLFPTSNWDFTEFDGYEIEQEGSVGFEQVTDVSQIPDWPLPATDYLTMVAPVYVQGNQYVDFYFDWAYKLENLDGGDDTGYINNSNWYELLLNDEVIISNRPGFPGRESFHWKGDVILANGFSLVTCQVNIRRFYVNENGFLNIRLYHGVTSISPPDGYKKIIRFDFDYRNDLQVVFRRRRNIEFTATKELALMSGGAIFDNLLASFIYQPLISPDSFQEINFGPGYRTNPFDNDSPLGWTLSVRLADWFILSANKDRIFIQRENSDFLYYVEDVQFLLPDASFPLIKINFLDGINVRGGDKLLLRIIGPFENPQTAAVRNAREQWVKTTNENGVMRLGKALAETMHDIYPTTLLAMEGAQNSLVFPLDVMQLEIKGALRNFMPVRIEMLPNEKTSNVTLIEYKNEKVGNYGS